MVFASGCILRNAQTYLWASGKPFKAQFGCLVGSRRVQIEIVEFLFESILFISIMTHAHLQKSWHLPIWFVMCFDTFPTPTPEDRLGHSEDSSGPMARSTRAARARRAQEVRAGHAAGHGRGGASGPEAVRVFHRAQG